MCLPFEPSKAVDLRTNRPLHLSNAYSVLAPNYALPLAGESAVREENLAM